MQQRPFWFLLNIYGWIILILSIVTAALIGQAWVVLLGVVGYLIALLADLIGGGSLGRTGAIRLARIEQENRELRAEQARLLGAIQEKDALIASMKPNKPAGPEAPDIASQPSPPTDKSANGQAT